LSAASPEPRQAALGAPGGGAPTRPDVRPRLKGLAQPRSIAPDHGRPGSEQQRLSALPFFRSYLPLFFPIPGTRTAQVRSLDPNSICGAPSSRCTTNRNLEKWQKVAGFRPCFQHLYTSVNRRLAGREADAHAEAQAAIVRRALPVNRSLLSEVGITQCSRNEWMEIKRRRSPTQP
jgi:hypothetical protein